MFKMSIGENAPEEFNVIVEIPKNSQNKYEFDEESGMIKLDRVLFSPMHYPTDYGFIPETLSADGDHLDTLVFGSDPLFPGCAVKVRPIGILKMVDNGDEDYKILGVQVDNPRFDNIKDIEDIKATHEHSLKEIAHFFEAYKELEGKKVKIFGWEGSVKAKEEINKAREAYKQKK
ncbi:MAG: Inorganic pyrophosphatase [Candidatus Wolfebacteria bacterium GW2011_GWA2_42_10]|uniref:Inorganic pyrophosphatase n=2 Tax=Candidatus Wolfeibacteriota TaxID=1752735 RepID=A0A0G0XLV0_9BACT|nr:MAG: Inorganic pyrophosphatase [Candidatus Wolfebacteria bacterium GW2011_GWB1_41_12]KKS25447.1 MAG: Inorganic pyrophosphatase [Candidatus Wolfebacteria bacterium GW2011_GWA2_42_10]KKT56623.1 MAG: Inorganic pyrophosphatase [Candidatus Wolfebacteria bacterium GW2011_GWA1_44_24]